MSETTQPELSGPDLVRAEVRRIMQDEGKKMTDAARESGIPYGTFSAWLAGTYAGNNDRVTGDVQKWLEARQTQSRTRALVPKAPDFQMTRSAGDFFLVMEHAQALPDLVVITGGAGVGKSTAAEAYRQRTPNVWRMVAEPCHGSARMLLDSLVTLLGIEERGSALRMSRAIVQRLRGSGGLVIVDEAQHLSSHSLDQLRTIHDLAETGVALLGNERVFARLDGDGRPAQYAQLFSRVGMRLARPHPLRKDVDALLDAWGIREEAERRWLHVIARKPGALRGMTKTLRIAHMLAAADGSERPMRTHLEAAWQQLGNATVAQDRDPVAPARREPGAAA